MSRRSTELEEQDELKNKALIQEACDAWVTGTGSPYDLLADDMTWTIVGETVVAPVYTSKASFIDQVMRPFAARIKGRLTPTVHAIYAAGDSIALRADVVGVALDGELYRNQYAWFLKLQNGRIQTVVAFVDVKAFNDLFVRVTPSSSEVL